MVGSDAKESSYMQNSTKVVMPKVSGMSVCHSSHENCQVTGIRKLVESTSEYGQTNPVDLS